MAARIIEIKSLQESGVEVFATLTEAQIRNTFPDFGDASPDTPFLMLD